MIDHSFRHLDFKQQSVKTFWQGVNWENRPINPIKDNRSQVLTLTVQAYFDLIPWSGVAIAPSSPKPFFPEAISKSDTLEDFLNDIKFF